MDMDLEWCLSCATRLPARPVQSTYCSPACFRRATQHASTSATPIDAHSICSSSDDSEDVHDVHYASQWPGTSSSGIQAWRLQVAGARPKSPAIERPTSPSRTAAFALSTCNFARPELMRRHTPNQPVPPSTFVDKARHVLGKPSSLAAPIATSPPRAAVPSSTQASISSTASYITESLIATPASAVRPARPAGGLLHRVKSWVHLDAPTSRAVSPASNAKAEFVALPGMDSTATLVGEPAPLKKAVILLEDDDLPEFAAARVSRSPPGLRRAEFRAPQASRLALDGHPAYGSRCRGRVVSARPPLFSPFGHAL